jgi:hypothetical protein
MMHSRCLAPAALPLSRAPAGAMHGGTRLTWRAERTAEWVPARTTTSCLDSVKATYLGSVMAAAGSEAEAEAGVGSWLMVLQWTAKGRMADSKLMIGPIYGMGTVGGVEVQGVGVARSEMA